MFKRRTLEVACRPLGETLDLIWDECCENPGFIIFVHIKLTVKYGIQPQDNQPKEMVFSLKYMCLRLLECGTENRGVIYRHPLFQADEVNI